MIPIRVSRLPWRIVDKRAIVIQPKKGQVHELNETATFLWQLSDGSKDRDQIVYALCENFDIDTLQAQADYQEFFLQLEEKKLIEWLAEPAQQGTV